MSALEDRQKYTDLKMQELDARLSQTKELFAGKACVYVTGSFGRREAGPNSDLDLFIVGRRISDPGAHRNNILRRLDEICLKADLIKSTHECGLPEFDGDGRFLVRHSIVDLVKTLGQPHDDALNTFTARLLLLLESRVLIGAETYNETVDEIIAAYWADYEGHADRFLPAFLTNDILRLWRTFCVNYEAFTERQPKDKKIKRKLKNYKLKHSRLLTCYSAIIFLLAKYNTTGTVTPGDAREMTSLSPLDRLQAVLKCGQFHTAKPALERANVNYERFLMTTDVPEGDLLMKFEDIQFARRMADKSQEFGQSIYEGLTAIGNASPFHRLLVV